ncbi:MAG: radical SAM protein, partial [Candidatus Woesearchaeota archaeon]
INETKKIIKKLANEGIKRIDFTGGEPTIKKDLPEIFNYAKTKGIKVIALQTNGINLSNKKYLKELIKSGLKEITFSFHSHKKETYNKITNEKHYNKSIKALKNLSKAKITFSVSHVINKLNYQEIIKFIDFIKEYNPKSIYFSFLRPNGRTKKNKWIVPRLKEIKEHVIKAMEYCEKQNIRYEFEGLPLCYMGDYYKKSSEYSREFEKPTQGYVSSDGVKSDLHGDIHSNLKKKGDQCKSCKLNDNCVGVWKEYAEMFGTEELNPVKESK